MTRILSKTHWLIFTGVLAVLVGANWVFFFHTPIHEWSDLAVNALQIDRAKSFAEIHGNYSRFFFHHPGPAFFYWYAAFEWLSCDALRTGLPPHVIHTLAGLVLQTGFFALALGVASTWIRHRLFVPLALVLGAIHYSAAGHAFLSIWPPHVLLMPFLAFWVACVSVACGRGRHLPWVLLAGSFLVHGHVAQPLFVLTISVGAYACYWLRLRAKATAVANPWRAEPGAHLVAGALLLLFSVPLLIDLMGPAPSNFRAILDHLHRNSADRKSPLQALLYFLSFFGYVRNQDVLFATVSRGSLVFFREQFWLYLAWAIVAAVGIVGLVRSRLNMPPEAREFLRIGAVFWVVTVALCIIWGRLQTGLMADFNGHFFFSVNYLLLLGACAVAVNWVPARLSGRGTAGGLLLVAAIVAWLGLRATSVGENYPGLVAKRATLDALAADPLPGRPKRLVFSADDWPQIASVALALERAGETFYVDPMWLFMFERDHAGAVPAFGSEAATTSEWRFTRSVPAGGITFFDGLRLVFEPAALSPVEGEIDFSEHGNLDGYQLHGISTPSGGFAWTAQPDALLQFKALPAERDIELSMDAEPLLLPPKLPAQSIEIRFNGELVSSTSLTQAGVLHMRIPREMWNRQPVALLHLRLPNATSPAALGLSSDPRVLGLALRRLTARAAERLPPD
jgi:hypothetical protein